MHFGARGRQSPQSLRHQHASRASPADSPHRYSRLSGEWAKVVELLEATLRSIFEDEDDLSRVNDALLPALTLLKIVEADSAKRVEVFEAIVPFVSRGLAPPHPNQPLPAGAPMRDLIM